MTLHDPAGTADGDARLDHVAQRYRDAMARVSAGTLTEFSLTPYDRTDVPVAATVWDDGTADAHGVGYGASASAARVGALGELAERVLMQSTMRELPVTRASYVELVQRVGARGVADPVTLILDAGSDYAPDRPLSWVPAIRWRTGEQVLVPAEFAAFDGESVPAPRDGLITPITNGMGAGDTLERAVGHALLELVQRDGDNLVFRALDQGVVVDLSAATDPAVRTALDMLTSVGIRPLVKLAGTEFACVVYCVGADDDPDVPPVALSAIGEAAHPDRDVAVTKALLEFASSRARRNFAFGPLDVVEKYDPDYLAAELTRPVGPQEARAFEDMRDWTEYDADRMRSVLAPIFRIESEIALDALPSSAAREPTELLELLLDRLCDFDVLVVPGGRGGDMRCAKVLAPGLEVETMSYLRIGERGVRQLLARGSELVGRGDPAGGDQLAVPLTAGARDRLGGPVWIDRAAVRRAVGELYPLYREPRRHAVQRLAVD